MSEQEIHEAIEEFLIDRQSMGRSKATVRFYRTHVCGFADYLDDRGTETLDDLSRQDVRAFFAYLQRQDLSQDTLSAYDRAIRAFVRWCHFEYHFDNDLFAGRPKIKQTQELPETWDDSEIKALLATCEDDDAGIRDRAIMLLLLDTGLRAGELVGLRMDDLTLEEGLVRVQPRRSKSKTERRVPLCLETVRALRAWIERRPAEAEALFVGYEGCVLSTNPLTPNGLNQLIRRHVKAAGIKAKPRLCHIWRHTFAKRYIMAGGDIETLRRLLGHQDLTVIAKYLNFKVADLREKHKRFSPVGRLFGTASAD